MTNLQDKIWYACYSSNILEERFICYIKGGQPKGVQTKYEGCTDKTLPTDNEDFIYVPNYILLKSRAIGTMEALPLLGLHLNRKPRQLKNISNNKRTTHLHSKTRDKDKNRIDDRL